MSIFSNFQKIHINESISLLLGGFLVSSTNLNDLLDDFLLRMGNLKDATGIL